MIKAVIDLRGMDPQDAFKIIGKNLEGLKEGEILEFIINNKEIISQIQKSNLRIEMKSVGEDYILKVYGGRLEIKEEKENGEIEIDENTNVGKLVNRYPEAIEILASYGFTPIKNPILRKTLAKTITLKQAKMLERLSDEKFEKLLNELKNLKKSRGGENV